LYILVFNYWQQRRPTMPKVISIINQKGGSGKTTASTNIASQLHSEGFNVLLVDIDPQGSASNWSAAKGDSDDTFPVIKLDKTLQRDLPRIAKGYDYVIIDGAPQVSELAAVAIRVADVVIIPVQPSPYDVWACADLVDVVKTRQMVTDGQPKAAFLISMAMDNTNITAEIKEVIKGYELPVLKHCTHRTVLYAETAKTGESVISLKKAGDLHPAALDIKNITAEIKELLND
jgi:chromosome partitioning protein